MKIFILYVSETVNDGRGNTNLRDPQLLIEVRNPHVGDKGYCGEKRNKRKV